MFKWQKDLSKKEKRTLWTCFAGWAMDIMDTFSYSFVIPTLIMIWGLTKPQAGLLGTAALLSSAFGGWIAGILSDRFGRVKVLQITVIWFAFFTFLCGLSQNFEQLFILRILQGLGFGGEWAAGAVLIGEIIRAKDRGKAVGFVQSGGAVGWGAAVLLSTILFSILPQEIAWRVLFLIGILPALVIFFARRFVEESEVFKETKSKVQSRELSAGIWKIFSPALLRTTLLTCLLSAGAQGGYYAISTWLPTYLKTVKGLSIMNTGGYLAIIIIGAFLGYLGSAYLCDALGRRLNFSIFAICSALTVILYVVLPIKNEYMFFLGFPLGFFSAGIFSGMGPYFTELFPTEVRGNGQGFAYNFGRGLAALFPTFIGFLSQSLALGQAMAIFACVAYGAVVLAAFFLPETTNSELSTSEKPVSIS